MTYNGGAFVLYKEILNFLYYMRINTVSLKHIYLDENPKQQVSSELCVLTDQRYIDKSSIHFSV